jgi:predicted regulator of Ras-like GTPase activity (Roadblock/LC7/MglB family)
MKEFGKSLRRLSRVAGVRGALIVDTAAGVPVATELAAEVDGAAIAALACSLFQRAAAAVERPGFGSIRSMQLESATGHLIVAGAGEIAVAALTEADAQLGMVRLEARRAAEELR